MARKAGGKNESLARLHAESLRFQDELNRIRSSAPSCQHHHSHVESSEESSENSAWDSPQTLKELVAAMPRSPKCVTLTNASVQANPQEECASSRPLHVGRTRVSNGYDPCDLRHHAPTWFLDAHHHALTCKQCGSNENCVRNPGHGAPHHVVTSKPGFFDDYNVCSPASANAMERHRGFASCSHTLADPAEYDPFSQENIHNSTCINGVNNPAKKDVMRITATTVFTANGGHLVLTAPRSFPNEDRGARHVSMLPHAVLAPCTHDAGQAGELQEQEPWKAHTAVVANRQNVVVSQEQKAGWKSTTTVLLGNGSAHVCTESTLDHAEENKDHIASAALGSNMPNQLDKPTAQDILENQQQRSFEECSDADTPSSKPKNVDDSDTMEYKGLAQAPRTRFFEKFTKLKEAVKTGKDSILAKRMASRIKFILQNVDSRARASHGQFGSTSEKGQWELGLPQDTFWERQRNHGFDKRDSDLQLIESQGFLDPESYLENVVLALSLHKSQGDEEEFLEPKIVKPRSTKQLSFNLAENSIIRSKADLHTDKECQTKTTKESILLDHSPILEGKTTTLQKRDFGADLNNEMLEKSTGCENQDISNDSSMQNFQQKASSVFEEQENQTNTAASALLEGANSDDCQKTQGPAMGERLAFNGHDHSGLPSTVDKKFVEHVEKDPQSTHKVDRIERAGEASSLAHDCNPLVLETSTSISNAANLENFTQHPLVSTKSEPSNAKKSLMSDTGYWNTANQLVITHKSILDFPVEAAVQAANDLARNLVRGAAYRTARGNAEQLASAQHDRTRHATKAVQALIGEGFDYSSMYQDLKNLQGERRKLEMRAKTTIHLPTDLQHTIKQTSLGGEHLQRRKAEIADPGSGAKRQRTTKSPNRDDKNKKPNPNIWRRHLFEKKDDMPTWRSSFDVLMYDHSGNKDMQKHRFDIGRERKDQAVYNHIQRQQPFKAPKFSSQSTFHVDVKKKNTVPPVWVERLTQGRRSHNLKFSIREPTGGLATKNLVRRKSVRPPGSIFKASNPIHWVSKPISAKDSSLQKKRMSKLERQEDFTSKLKGFNDSTYELGSTSKSAQNEGNGDLSRNSLRQKSRTLFDDEVVGIMERQKRDEDDKLNVSPFNGIHERMSLTDDAPTKEETLPINVPDGVSSSLLDDSSREPLEQHSEKNAEDLGKEEMPLVLKNNGRTTLSRGLWDIGLLEKTGTEDNKKQIEREVTKDDLLAMTLQSILNNQSTSNNDTRFCAEANDVNCRSIDHLVESTPHVIEEDKKQDSKSVQTMEHNPSQVAISPLPIFPAFLMSNGSMLTSPSYYVQCPHANHSWMSFEQGQSCSACDPRSRKQGSSTKTSERNRKNTQKGVKWSKRIYANNQESSSSTTTPSSPASIHEIEDICETGREQTNDLCLSLPFSQDRGLEHSFKDLRTKTDSVEHSMKVAALPVLENKAVGEPLLITREVEECDLLNKESIERENGGDNKVLKGEQKEAQTELNSTLQLDWQPEIMELPMASERPRNTDFGSSTAVDEQTETKKRLSLIPYKNHIYPSPQNSARRTLANISIPSWALVAKPSTLPFMKLPMVPSWSEIKRPMMISSSSDTEEAGTSDTNSSSSIGELQQKALTILRESALTPFAKIKGHRKSAHVTSDTSEGEIVTTRPRKHENHPEETIDAENHNDHVELGEVLNERPSLNLNQVCHESSSEGEMSLGYYDPGEI